MAAGLSLGSEWHASENRRLGVEVIYRRSSCLGDCGLSSGFLGVQMVIPF